MIYRRIMPISDADDPFVQGLTGTAKPKTTQQAPALQRQKPRPDMGGDAPDDAEAMAELILQAKRDAEKNTPALSYLKDHAPDDVYQRVKQATEPAREPFRLKSTIQAQEIRKAGDYLQGAGAPEDVVQRVKKAGEPERPLAKLQSPYGTPQEAYNTMAYLRDAGVPEAVANKVYDHYYQTVSPAYDKYLKEREFVQNHPYWNDSQKQAILNAVDDAHGIIGKDGLPNVFGINPKTGNYNLNGADLVGQDLYLIANLGYQTAYTPKQIITMFTKLKKTGGNLTAQDMIDLGVQPSSNPFTGPDALAALASLAYRTAMFGTTFASLDAQARQEKFGQALGVIGMRAMGANPEGVLGYSRKGQAGGVVRPYNSDKGLNANGSILDRANYAQNYYRETFSKKGQEFFSGIAGKPIKTIDDLTNAIKNGIIKVDQVPINYITTIDGNTLILNTRSSQALIRAGIPRNLWNAINKTGDAFFEGLLRDQLTNNGLTTAGTPNVYSK